MNADSSCCCGGFNVIDIDSWRSFFFHKLWLCELFMFCCLKMEKQQLKNRNRTKKAVKGGLQVTGRCVRSLYRCACVCSIWGAQRCIYLLYYKTGRGAYGLMARGKLAADAWSGLEACGKPFSVTASRSGGCIIARSFPGLICWQSCSSFPYCM